ncbi:uncharacterized protein UBRO2_04251 [Ustilago bromivora]|uniref:Uncharacterized protein n=1 Tax=Ustilago bromivora TaxID=307758 RepID=A0A8H8QPD6_9BASI|nr:uncharacterized protein UBRO2_04251 [Ustilago bromivora]
MVATDIDQSWHPACLPHCYLLHKVLLSLSPHRQPIFFNPATCSHQSPFSSATKTICAGPTFAPASSVITLGAQVDSINSRISRLEDTIHLNFTTILTHIDSLQSSPHPPSTPTSLPTITSQPPLPETPAQAGLVFMDGQVRITKESSEQRSSSFAKVIPNICVLAQVWLVYTAICIHHTRDLDLNNALLAYLEIIIEFNQIYLWKGVTKYHLAICHQRFDLTFVPTATKNILSNRAALAAGSSRPTPTPPRRVLNDRAMSPTTTGSGPAVTLLPASSSPGSGLANMMLPAFSPPGSSLVDMLLPAPSSSGSSLADMLQPTSPSLGSGLTGGMFLVTSLGSGLVDQKLSATLPSTSCAPSASSAMLVPSLDFFMPQGITDMSPDSASTLLVSLLTGPAPQAHPNTACELPIFNHSDTPTTVGSLKLEHWAPFLNLYPDQDFANQLRGALHHGTLLGYSGPLHHTTWLEGSNLPMDLDDELHLCREIEARVLEGCLQWVNDPGAACLVCSPVGVVPKPHNPFGTGVTLTAPAVPLTTCVVKALKACGIPPEGYSGHSFQHGAATWAAANRTDSNMIQGLGHWRSDCFRRYVNTLAAECAATSASALYSNADQPLNLSQPAWHNF